ncbi:type VI secretion system membrane subunit TssM [Tatumella sp. JGM118]|uniref:type VI secretion system membrane subunit TssM n=1 Tax=Tatumella sp. JGM118 TaxID=2799796 RepID=UPI001BAFF712|nr:type VI secretion system membrane subunit TssM [Tatumella sp. JGM118]MBS0910183.1 type VI secretion system membrane subunit TssM [Tatumella sp. JGM118]
MSFLRRLVSRDNILLLLRLVIAGVLMAVIWFTGPKIGFGDARPLADVLPRLLAILFIIFLFITSLARWHGSLTVLVTGIVLLWVTGPCLSFGEGFFLSGVTTRLLLTGLMLVVWLCYCVVLWLRRRGYFRRPAAEQGIAEAAEVSDGIDAMFRQVNQELQQRTKAASRRGRLTGLIRRQEMIPWYLLLGSQGAGKTTAVSLCGQHFPLTETMEPLSVSAGHPELCRCWLANDAVYLDTDGKYVSAAQSSQAEWLTLQNALKASRPGVAINGVLLMVSAQELTATDQDTRERLAATLRHRLSELRRIHDQFFPVYLVVTQLDYLCGFAEYFRGLSRQEQQDIWGISFPAGAGESLVSQQAEQQLVSLVQRIESEINVRLLKEYDPADRKKMYGFPGDLSVLVQNLRQFLQTLFFPSRYDDTGNGSALRGIYLTSCYPGDTRQFTNPLTVIRQWAGYVSPPAAEAEAEAAPPRRQGPGHPCFLHQLFCELIIRDQSLAAKTSLTFSGPVIRHWLKHSALLLLLMVISYGLYRSYQNNTGYLQAVSGKTAALREAQERFMHLQPSARPAELPPLLAGFRHLPDAPGLDLADPGLNWRYGLFTGHRVAEVSQALYREMLQKTLLPFLRQYAARQLTLALAERSYDTVYVSLRRYLMLYGIIPADVPFLTRDLSGLWPEAAPLSAAPADISVIPHLTQLFRLPQTLLREPADEALIRRARDFLGREDAPARLYLRLKKGLSADEPPPLDLRQMAGDSSQPLFSLQAEAPVPVIPGLFTRAGYQQVKKKILLQVTSLAREDKAVMGQVTEQEHPDPASQLRTPATIRLYHAVMDRYLSEYARTWQHYLAEIRLRPSVLAGHASRPGYRQLPDRLGQLASIDSPLFTLLQRSVAETTLADSPEAGSEKSPVTAGIAGVRQGLKAYNDDRQSVLRRQVDNRFKSLRYFVRAGGEATPAAENCQTETPLCQLRAQLEELQILLSAQQAESEKASAQAVTEFIAELLTRSSAWPLPVSNIVQPLLEQIAAVNRQTATARTAAGIAAGPVAYCRKILAGRYPFIQTAREVSGEDFNRFFSGEESAGAYFNQHLAGKTVVTEPAWHFTGTAPADSENRSLEMFSNARQIRQAFFPGGAAQLSLPLKISVPWLSPGISRLELRTASQRLTYSHGPVRQTAIHWPATESDPSVTLSLTSARTGETRTRRFTGPWALFRWLDSAQQLRITLTGEVAADFGTGDGSSAATLQIAGLVFHGESLMTLLRRFTCP